MPDGVVDPASIRTVWTCGGGTGRRRVDGTDAFAPALSGGIGPAGVARMTGGDRGSLRLLQLTSFASTLDRFAMPPVLLAISRDLDVPLPSVVTAAGVYYVAYGAMQPVWGMVSDRLGRVRTLRITLLLAAVATAASAGVQDIVGLTVARGMAGAFFGAAMPTCLIYVGDMVPTARRQQEVARLLVGVALGTALAAVGAGALAQVASWRLAFVMTGTCALVLCVLLRRCRSRRPRPRQSLLAPLRQVAGTPVALLVLALSFTEGVVLLGTLTLLPAAVESAGTAVGGRRSGHRRVRPGGAGVRTAGRPGLPGLAGRGG